MRNIPGILLALSLMGTLSTTAQIIREDFKENPAHIPISNDDLTSPFLELRCIGSSADKLKLSHHPEKANDPHYLWNGQCAGPILAAFHFKKRLDLSDPSWVCRLRTKNVGASQLHLALKIDDKWFVQKKPIQNGNDWNTQSIPFSGRQWQRLYTRTALPGQDVNGLRFHKVEGIGFSAPVKPDGSKSCIRLDWFEISKNNQPPASAPSSEFLERSTPFLRSALLVPTRSGLNRVRRGVLIRLGNGHWACFDPDLLRWAAIWKAPRSGAPLTYDSMAAISYPEGTAKAKSAPRLKGEVILQSPEQPGIVSRTDPRLALFSNKSTPVGPLPPALGRWLGLSLHDQTTVVHYETSGTRISEFYTMTPILQRVLKVEAHRQAIRLNAGPEFRRVNGEGATLENGILTLAPSSSPRVVTLGVRRSAVIPFPSSARASNLNTDRNLVRNPPARVQGPFTIRPFALPNGSRVIRPTDIAFLSDGTGLLSTFDGDIWRIRSTDDKFSSWSRIATGIFEPMSIETNARDEIFVLGRDQVTRLVDVNNDGIIDEYWNASDAFRQTLHTRDYSTSFAIEKDGSFLVAKGGIYNRNSKTDNELSDHRGAIVRLSPDGSTSTILADGLRLPYVGLRNDGAIFASDQQGQFIPSTPLHRLTPDRSFRGYQPTNFTGSSSVTEPLLWYPYQANRSGAAFTSTSPKAFPDLTDSFLQISWGGRLFAIETPRRGQPFSWQLPLQLDFPSLNGSSHPKSGRLFLTGLGISGYKPTTPNLRGLASIEQSSPLLRPVVMDVRHDHIRIVFNRPLTRNETIVPAAPALRMFSLKRTEKYGSGHFLWNGDPGEHRFQPSRFELSRDRRTFVLSFDHLRQSDVLDLHLTVTSGDTIFPLHLFTKPTHLPKADQRTLAAIARLESEKPALMPADRTRGQEVFKNYACAGCHSLDQTKLVGPSLKGLARRSNPELIRQSILDPNAVLTEGYQAAMPSYAGVLTEQQLADLLAFLSTLKQ